MDAKELKARIDAARAFKAEHAGMRFEGVMPSRLDMRSAVRRHRTAAGLDMDALLRGLVPGHVRGWGGVTQGHLVDGLDAKDAAEGIAFDADLLAALFAATPGAFDAVADAMLDAYNQREAALEGALKNSQSMSAAP